MTLSARRPASPTTRPGGAPARRFRRHDPRLSAQGRRPEHHQSRAPCLRPPRPLPRREPARRGNLHRERQDQDRQDLHRPGVRHGRPRAAQGRRQGGHGQAARTPQERIQPAGTADARHRRITEGLSLHTRSKLRHAPLLLGVGLFLSRCGKISWPCATAASAARWGTDTGRQTRSRGRPPRGGRSRGG